MIFGLKANLELYRDLGIAGRYAKAVDFLMNTDLENLGPGRYIIDGDDVFANVAEYTTIPWEETKFEVHENYTDIQCVIQGSEVISLAPVSQLNVSVPYNPEKGVMFFDNANPGLQVAVHMGEYMIFSPWGGHKSKAVDDEPAPTKEVVVKIKEN